MSLSFAAYVRLTTAMLSRGVWFLSRGVRALKRGVWFLSREHGDAVVDRTIEVFATSLPEAIGHA